MCMMRNRARGPGFCSGHLRRHRRITVAQGSPRLSESRAGFSHSPQPAYSIHKRHPISEKWIADPARSGMGRGRWRIAAFDSRHIIRRVEYGDPAPSSSGTCAAATLISSYWSSEARLIRTFQRLSSGAIRYSVLLSGSDVMPNPSRIRALSCKALLSSTT